MFTLDVLRDLYRHMEWADAEVWRVVRATAASGDDEPLVDWLRHLHSVQRFFFLFWRDEPIDYEALTRKQSLDEVRAGAREYYAAIYPFLDSLTPDDLATPKVVPWTVEYEKATGRRFTPATFAETLFQVTSHSTYHRGQVNTRIRAAGGEPPLVDFIAWVWFGKPEAGWEGGG